MGVTTYYSAGGELLGHRTDVGAAYGTDALGSVTVTAIDDQQRTPTNYYYKPYGSRLNKLGNSADPRYLWNGTSGYRETAISHSKSYVRARHLGQEEGRWTTVDPLWPIEAEYGYVKGRITVIRDASGLGPCPCQQRDIDDLNRNDYWYWYRMRSKLIVDAWEKRDGVHFRNCPQDLVDTINEWCRRINTFGLD